jgi:peroxiredoxin
MACREPENSDVSAGVPVDDGGADHLVAGVALPKVELQSTKGGKVSLSRVGRCIVYVYPWTGKAGFPNPPRWDDISGAHGSTPQAEGFRDRYDAFEAAGYDVVGISGQTGEEQGEFAARMGLPFALLSDAGFALADALRLPRFETGGVVYLKRLTLLVRDGVIAETIYPVVRPGEHAGEVLARLGVG